ncbi:hypothetical protein B0H10DRAFT_1813744, partial [Mycena sp. CBHHK59/15]
LQRKDWTVKLVYEGLFNYCFPPNFKWQLREKLMSAMQGCNNVRDFVPNIKALAVRFPDVTEQQLRQIFWDGILQNLRMYLVCKGLDPECILWRKLAKYATHAMTRSHNTDSSDCGDASGQEDGDSDLGGVLAHRTERDSSSETLSGMNHQRCRKAKSCVHIPHDEFKRLG